MSRSDDVRQKCRELDGFRCALCGYDGREEQFRPWVVPHHGVAEDGRKLGMGGSDEQDTVENTITLCSSLGEGGFPPNRRDFLGGNEGSCHDMVERGHLRIVRWGRPQLLNYPEMIHDTDLSPEYGPGILEVLDVEQRVIPHDKLWFYRRQHVEQLEKSEARVQALGMIDKDVAKDLWTLKCDDSFKELEPTATSFSQYAASRGWSSYRASMLANLYGQASDEWPEGMSAADFKRTLKDAGKAVHQLFWYGIMNLDTRLMRFVQSRNEAELIESLTEREGMLRVVKWCKRGVQMRGEDDG